MRVWVLLAVLAASAVASDKSFCEKKCEINYDEDVEKSGCLKGCEFRGSTPNTGMFFFIECHRQCDVAFENSSTSAGKACHYACTLPMMNSVFMSVNYNSNGKPEVKVIRHDGPSDEISPEDTGLIPSDSGDFFKGFELKPRQEAFDDHYDHFRRMEEQLQGFLSNMRSRLANAFNSDEFERPLSIQHTGFENTAGNAVGNMNGRGLPIILTHPVLDSDEDNSEELEREIQREIERDPHIRVHPNADRWFHSARKALILQLFLLAFSIISILISVGLLLRIVQKRRERYQRIQMVNATHVANISIPSPLASFTIEKKIPLEDFEGAPPSDGIPPPAYDQLSLGSIHKKMAKGDQ